MAGNPLWGILELAKGSGTSQAVFQLDDDNTGPKLKNNSGVLEFKNSADNAFIIGRGLSPVGDNDFAIKSYVDNLLDGLDWQNSVLARQSAVGTETLGYRYIIEATGSDAITAVVIGTKTFTVAGDQTALYAPDDIVKIKGSTGNDKYYTVVSDTFDTDHTDIVVSEVVSDDTVDGDIYYSTGAWSTIGVDKIAVYNGSSWDTIDPNQNFTCGVDDEDLEVTYNGPLDTGAWVVRSSTTTHNQTTGLQGGTVDEYYHLTNAEHTEISTFFAATDMTGAEAQTLTGGAASDASSLHIHDNDYYTESEVDTFISNLVDGTTPFTGIDVNGGVVDAITLGTNSVVTEAQIDYINLNGSTINESNSTDLNLTTTGNANITLTPAGTGEVDISKVDIDSGVIDGTTIGGTTPAAGSFTNISGAVTSTYEAITSAKTLDGEDVVLNVDTSGGAVAITLPDATAHLGHSYIIYLETAGNDLTVVCAGDNKYDDGVDVTATVDVAKTRIDVTAVADDIWSIKCNNAVLS